MEHCSTATCDLAAEIAVADISAYYLQLRVLYFLEPSPVVERVVLCKCTHLAALREQSFREVRAYESVGAGYEYRLVFVNHP